MGLRRVYLTARIPMDVEHLLQPPDVLEQYMLKLTALPSLLDTDYRRRERICIALISLASSVRNSSSTQVYEGFFTQSITD